MYTPVEPQHQQMSNSEVHFYRLHFATCAYNWWSTTNTKSAFPSVAVLEREDNYTKMTDNKLWKISGHRGGYNKQYWAT